MMIKLIKLVLVLSVSLFISGYSIPVDMEWSVLPKVEDSDMVRVCKPFDHRSPGLTSFYTDDKGNQRLQVCNYYLDHDAYTARVRYNALNKPAKAYNIK